MRCRKNPVVTDEVASKVPVVDWQPDRQNTRSKKEADMQMRTKDSLGASLSTDRQTDLEASRAMRWQFRSVAVPRKLASEAWRDRRASLPPRRAPCQVGAHAAGGMTHHVSCRGVRLSLARLMRPFAGTKGGTSLRGGFRRGR